MLWGRSGGLVLRAGGWLSHAGSGRGPWVAAVLPPPWSGWSTPVTHSSSPSTCPSAAMTQAVSQPPTLLLLQASVEGCPLHDNDDNRAETDDDDSDLENSGGAEGPGANSRDATKANGRPQSCCCCCCFVDAMRTLSRHFGEEQERGRLTESGTHGSAS